MPYTPEPGDTSEDIVAVLSEEVAELRESLRKASVLVRLITVRQVIQAGDEAIYAAGLNPWCINEGLATGDERISPSWTVHQ